MTDYRRLKPFFTRGRFVGVDTFAHGHALPEREAAVFVLFNLTGQPVTRTIDIAVERLGLSGVRSAQGATARVEGGRLRFQATVPAPSPLLIELNTNP